MAHWLHECEKVEQRFGFLLTSELWSDCIFLVGSETKPEKIEAHKLVLVMASPVFEAMFYGWFSERYDAIVRIPDIQPEAFRGLLQYIYTGNIKIGSLDFAWDVLYAAKKYILPHLEKECNRYICSVLNPMNVLGVYGIACFFDDIHVMDECIKEIIKNTDEIIISKSLEDVDLNTLITVFSLNHLSVKKESNLFEALVQYNKAEKRRQEQISPPVDGKPPSKKMCKSLESSTSEEKVLLRSVENGPVAEQDSKPPSGVCSEPTADKENLKEEKPTIRAALQKIRFLTMTGEEFNNMPHLSNLLTREDITALYMNIVCKYNPSQVCPLPMPIGFSVCQMPRQPDSRYVTTYMKRCLESGCCEYAINALKSGDPSKVKKTGDVVAEFLCDERKFDQRLLDALVPALTEGDKMCKVYAAQTIQQVCERGSPLLIRALAASAALEPYLRLLSDVDACFDVLRGLIGMLTTVPRNASNTDFYSYLREIGLPQLLLTVPQDKMFYFKSMRGTANYLLRKYFNNGQ